MTTTNPEMRTLDLKAIEERALGSLRAPGDPAVHFIHDTDRAMLATAIAEGRGPVETLALVATIQALQATLAAVIPFAESRAEDLDEAAGELETDTQRRKEQTEPGVESLKMLRECEQEAAEVRASAAKAAVAVDDAKAELDSLTTSTRPLAKSMVCCPDGQRWTVRVEYIDEKGRRCTAFLGSWTYEEGARAARRSWLRGEHPPEADAP